MTSEPTTGRIDEAALTTAVAAGWRRYKGSAAHDDIAALIEDSIKTYVAQVASEPYRLIFDGYPGPDGPRFIELEDANGRSVSYGKWTGYPGHPGWAQLTLPARRSPSPVSVSVKPLEWESVESTSQFAAVRAWWCMYRITLRSDGRKQLRLEWLGNRTDDLGVFPEWAEAMAAAQADYERRILSALNIGGTND